MREILFRGIRKDTHEWVYGFYGEYFNGNKNISCISVVDTHAIAGSFCYAVIPETVSQFTGLYDINGKKIFEGDIVYYDGSCHKVVFESRNGTCYFGIVVGENETWGFGNSTPAYMMAVVGNIYDNPELLDVTE